MAIQPAVTTGKPIVLTLTFIFVVFAFLFMYFEINLLVNFTNFCTQGRKGNSSLTETLPPLANFKALLIVLRICL
jgi:hypothetical protein